MNALVYVDVDQGLNKVKLISLEHFKLSVAINRTYTVRECGPHAHCADCTPHFLRSRCSVGVSAGAVIHTPLEFSAGASADHTPK